MVLKNWKSIAQKLDFAYQPIVNIHTGMCFGVEALLRNWQQAGFNSIFEVFDQAFQDQDLYGLDVILREKAIRKFTQIPHYRRLKLFFNLDNRLLQMPDFSPDGASQVLHELLLDHSSLCYEISERHEFVASSETRKILSLARQQTFKIALDDFGAGYSGLQTLYESEPDYVKIDRFFISDICTDARKKLFVGNIVHLAHTLGIQVVAEGVETPNEFYACKEIGCDYVQGYLVSKPTQDVNELCKFYGLVDELNIKDRRFSNTDMNLLKMQMCKPQVAEHPQNSVHDLFEMFRHSADFAFVPIVDSNQEPLGIIHEKSLKEYVYSPYGKELLKNRNMQKTLLDFCTKTPVAEITTPIERILEVYSLHSDADCVLLTQDGEYHGLLTSRTLLTLLNEKNLAAARDLNPLSKLPGNTLISECIANILHIDKMGCFAYFDFDNFKPFNDLYGFRTGDRAIQVFADILKSVQMNHKLFIGHVGGDDFFMATSKMQPTEFEKIVKECQKEFKNTAETLYTVEDRQSGFIKTLDRNGKMTKYSLLQVSVAVICVVDGEKMISEDTFSTIMARTKKIAKENASKYSVRKI